MEVIIEKQMDFTIDESVNEEIRNEEFNAVWFTHVDADNWQQVCRLCAKQNDNLIPIHEQGQMECDIPSIINKYLPFKVSENDGFPTHCCHQCLSLIISWNEFIDSTSKANEKLNKFYAQMNAEHQVLKVVENEKLVPEIVMDEVYCGADEDNISEEAYVVEEVETNTIDSSDAQKEPNMEIDDDVMNEEAGVYFELRNDDNFTETIHGVSSGDNNVNPITTSDEKKVKSKREQKSAEPPPELQEYVLHQPMKYVKINGCQYLRTKVFGFEPQSAPKGKENVPALFFICTICNETMINFKVIDHSKSHYPLKVSDSCRLCYFGFNSVNSFRNHLKRHTVYIDEVYKPQEQTGIEDVFRQSSSKDKDQNKITNKGISIKNNETFVCEFCGVMYNNRKIFLQHIRRVHVTPFVCKLCRKRFSNKGSLKKHRCVEIVTKGPNDKVSWFNCKCKKIFLFEDQYLNHIKICDRAKFVTCEECGREFPDQPKLDSHILRQHIRLQDLEQRPSDIWICEICGCHLSSLSARKHYLTHKFVEKKCKCIVCGMKFTNKTALDKHTQSHSDLRPFTCNICNATFKRKDHVKLHMRNKHNVYKDEMKYECKKCKRYFTTQSYLIRHQRLHSQGVSYECVVCRSRFPTEHSLKMHQTRTKHDTVKDDSETKVSMNTADWVNRFRCNVCNQRYGSINSLKKHSLVHLKKPLVADKGKETDNCNEDDIKEVDLIVEQEKPDSNPENIYECQKCSKRYLSPFGLKLHLSRTKHGPVVLKGKRKQKGPIICNTSEKNPRFKCSECNEMFGTLLSLKMHKIKRKHFSQCPSCDKRFALEHKLRKHLIKVHHRNDIDAKINEFTPAEIKPYQCGDCKQKFSMHHNFVTHMQRKHNVTDPQTLNLIYIDSEVFEQKTADGETPVVYQCTDCLDNFLTEEEFQNHTHETTSYIVPEQFASNIITTEIVEHNASLPLVTADVILPVENG